MPNLRLDRRKARQESAQHRQATYDMEYGPVAHREAERGYPARLNAEQDAAQEKAKTATKRKRSKP